MKLKLYIFSGKGIIIFFFIPAFLFSGSLRAQQFLTTIDGWNAFVHLPPDYADSPNKVYPLICFVPGVGEFGTDPNRMLVYGPSRFIYYGDSMKFIVNHEEVRPIVISIQPINTWTPDPWTVNRKLDSIMARWRCDPTRLNVTGLSMGGATWENYVNGWDPAFTNRITSMVCMSAVAPDNPLSDMAQYASAGGKWWGFEGTQDYHQMDQIRDYMNASEAGSGRYTQYIGGHCCWNNWYDPAYNEFGESIYTWMLKQRKEGFVPIPNISPESYAGSDSALSSIVPIYTLHGAANDPDGNNFNFKWTKLSGPVSLFLGSANSPVATVIGLLPGIYQYQLAITDTLGGVGYDTVTLYNGTTIPVKLTDFTARLQKDKVLLQWKTVLEINSSHFEVERSTDGQSFSNIGTVAASGNSSIEKNYQFTDVLPSRGMNYYRLKMLDKDGKSEYSSIVNVNIKSSSNPSMITAANIVNGRLTMNISSTQEQAATISVLDANGKTMQQINTRLIKGPNSIVKPIVLAKGIYYIRLNTDETSSGISLYNE
ncbi:MAG: hypothetical protein ABJA78_15795 [Ferruginibacter sp.]